MSPIKGQCDECGTYAGALTECEYCSGRYCMDCFNLHLHLEVEENNMGLN